MTAMTTVNEMAFGDAGANVCCLVFWPTEQDWADLAAMEAQEIEDEREAQAAYDRCPLRWREYYYGEFS